MPLCYPVGGNQCLRGTYYHLEGLKMETFLPRSWLFTAVKFEIWQCNVIDVKRYAFSIDSLLYCNASYAASKMCLLCMPSAVALKSLHFACTVYLCASYYSQNALQLFPQKLQLNEGSTETLWTWFEERGSTCEETAGWMWLNYMMTVVAGTVLIDEFSFSTFFDKT
jgi:hypothetical protein